MSKKGQHKEKEGRGAITPHLVVGIIIFIFVFLLFLSSLQKGDLLTVPSLVYAILLIGVGFTILHFNPLMKRK